MIPVSDLAAAFGIAAAILSFVGGMAWWMSAVYYELKSTRKYLESYVKKNESEKRLMWARIEGTRIPHYPGSIEERDSPEDESQWPQ